MVSSSCGILASLWHVPKWQPSMGCEADLGGLWRAAQPLRWYLLLQSLLYLVSGLQWTLPLHFLLLGKGGRMWPWDTANFFLTPFKPGPHWPLGSQWRAVCFLCRGWFYFPSFAQKSLGLLTWKKRRVCIPAGVTEGHGGHQEKAVCCFLGGWLADEKARTSLQ